MPNPHVAASQGFPVTLTQLIFDCARQLRFKSAIAAALVVAPTSQTCSLHTHLHTTRYTRAHKTPHS
jgi:hypothetical protein